MNITISEIKTETETEKKKLEKVMFSNGSLSKIQDSINSIWEKIGQILDRIEKLEK
jgi:hypothetical protein